MVCHQVKAQVGIGHQYDKTAILLVNNTDDGAKKQPGR